MGGKQSTQQPPSYRRDNDSGSHPELPQRRSRRRGRCSIIADQYHTVEQQWNYDSGSLPPNYAMPYYMPEQPAHVPVVPSVPVPQQQPQPQPQQQPQPQWRFDRRNSIIADQYHTVEQVVEALAQAGLESSNLIVGVDFTKSNEWTGKLSFHGQSLHHISDINPYEHAISIIGQTLSNFDDDNLIPCYGFGDASTHDRDVFSFYPDDRPCNGFPEALKRYRELVPHVRLAGPTSFAPIVEMATTIVEKSGGQYHILLIIADGQVTRSVDTDDGRLSPQEQMTVDAIVKASELPLSIVLVGVGDGPWDMMKEFDDNIPARSFDNFQFVNFTEIMLKNLPQRRKEAEFALRALLEIPLQYKATLDLGILGRQSGRSPNRVALPPPSGTFTTAYPAVPEFSKSTASPYPAYNSFKTSANASFSKSTALEEPSSDAQVVEGLAQAGLKSSNLIVGVDFTNSNEWTGRYSFHGRSLHHISDTPNPYEHAISIIGRTLSNFDDDNLIPCYGFGDASTHDIDVFSFYPDGRPCNGFPEALKRYRELVPHVRLAGPTSFAPIVEMAMTTVEKSGGQYCVLLIIADGQVTRNVDTDAGRLSPQEQMTVDAIVKASELPLSIVLVGVGDGPWDMMKEFNDNMPARSFDNFQFVNFTEIMSKNLPQRRKEAEFARIALMEIPLQYKATLDLGILGRQSGRSPNRVALPPPCGTSTTAYPAAPEFSKSTASSYPAYDSFKTSASALFSKPTAPEEPCWDARQFVCPVCLVNLKDMAFGCGHQTCVDCSQNLLQCPICRTSIEIRIKLY